MRMPDYIYRKIQEQFPDLFIEAGKSRAVSTVFAEFLPGAALSDPNGNPWGQYGNREIPPRRKTIIISFNDLENLPFSKTQEIDTLARFLKRAGFTVLIPVGDAIVDYSMQLFDREHINNVGNKTRAEMQKMALVHNVPADEIFFIDEVKKEVDEKFFKTMIDQFSSMGKNVSTERPEESYYASITDDTSKAVSKNAGIIEINIPKTKTESLDKEYIEKALKKANEKQKSLQINLTDALVFCERVRERKRERDRERDREFELRLERDRKRERKLATKDQRKWEREHNISLKSLSPSEGISEDKEVMSDPESIFSDDENEEKNSTKKQKSDELTDYEMLLLIANGIPEELKEKLSKVSKSLYFSIVLLIRAGAPLAFILSLREMWGYEVIEILRRSLHDGNTFETLANTSDDELQEILKRGMHSDLLKMIRIHLNMNILNSLKILETKTTKIIPTKTPSPDLATAERKLRSLGLTLDIAISNREDERYGEEIRENAERREEKKQLNDYEILLLTMQEQDGSLENYYKICKKIQYDYMSDHALDIMLLVRAGISFEVLAEVDARHLLDVIFHVDDILKPEIDYAGDISFLTKEKIRLHIADSYVAEAMAVVEALQRQATKKITPKEDVLGENRDTTRPNLYNLTLKSNPSAEQQELLLAHAHLLEEIEVEKFDYFSEMLSHHPVPCFSELACLQCEEVSGTFSIQAPKLISLRVFLDSQCKNATLCFNSLPSLAHLLINFKPFYDPDENGYPIIQSKKNINLTELAINGKIRSLAFIENLLADSPNLKVLTLVLTCVPEEELKELGKRFPGLSINVLMRYDDSYDRNLRIRQQAQAAQSESRDPHLVHQAVKPQQPLQSVAGAFAALGSMLGFSSDVKKDPVIIFKECVSDIFEWRPLSNLKDKSGVTQSVDETTARSKLKTRFSSHGLVYEKYQAVLVLQKVISDNLAKMSGGLSAQISAYEDLLAQLEKMKGFLEENNEDYKEKTFGHGKSTTKKDFYERVTKAIIKANKEITDLRLSQSAQVALFSALSSMPARGGWGVSSSVGGPDVPMGNFDINALQPTHVNTPHQATGRADSSQSLPKPPLPATSPTSSTPIEKPEQHTIYSGSADFVSDFDTKHNPEETHTLEVACSHLSTKKENRFQYTRDGIYTLDENCLVTPLEARVFESIALPQHHTKLPTDDSHDFYEFKSKIQLNAGEFYRLKSLSAHDVLFQLTLNGKPIASDDVEIKKDNSGFYTITAKKALSGNLSYIFDIPAEKKTVWGAIPKTLQDIILHIQSFPPSGIEALTIDEQTSPTDKLDAMFESKKGACRHRVAILLHQLEKLKAKNPALCKDIGARIVNRGGVHTNIEISVDNGKTFEILELGGYEVKMQYVSTKLPPLKFSSKTKKEEHKPVFSNVLSHIDSSRGKNIFLGLQNESGIYTCLSHIRAQVQKTAEEKNINARPIFYVDSPDQLRISLKRLKLNEDRTRCEIVKPPAGLLQDFLMAHHNSDPPPIIVINWNNFKPSDMVQFNSVFESDTKKRFVDSTPIPLGATIVGLHSRSEKMLDLLCDASFVSRHSTGGIYDFSDAALPVVIASQATPQTTGKVLKINLHKSSRWQDMVIGKAFVDGEVLKWQDGQLLELLSDPTITRVEFINPPVNDRVFQNMVSDLRAGLPLVVLNQVKPIDRKMDVAVLEKPEFVNDIKIEIVKVDALVEDAFIINASTFEQLLHGKQITGEGFLIAEKGLIEQHAEDILKLCLCDTLSDSQWSFLLDYAKRFDVTLDLSVTKNVSLPSALRFTEKLPNDTQSTKPSLNTFVISDDVEYSVAKLQSTLPSKAPVIDFSEVTIDDLLCKTEHSITDSGFRFQKQMSFVWDALSHGETVILKGICSPELFDYLTPLFSPKPYFYFEGKKVFFPGKLIVVADESTKQPIWLAAKNQKISLAEKCILLELPAPTADTNNKPFVQLQMEKKKAAVPKQAIESDVLLTKPDLISGLCIDGKQLKNNDGAVLGSLSFSTAQDGQVTLRFSGDEQYAFSLEQRKALSEFLDQHGFNKPTPASRAISLNVTHAIEVINTTQAASHDLSLSACEAFETKRLNQVKDILAYSPFVLLEGAPGVGKSYFVRSLEQDPSVKFYRENEIEKWATEIVPEGVQKILFRDEINLRGLDCAQDRDLMNDPSSIFHHGKYYPLNDNCKIMYAQNPLDYGGERREPKLFQDLPDCIVTFAQMSPAFILHRLLKPIFETTFDADESEKRAAKIIADNFATMRSIRDLQTKAIFECALHRHPIPVSPIAGTKEVCFGLDDFVLTTSRHKPYCDVLTLLQARTFKRELPESAPNGARFNGVNGLVLQGPPGVGKSDFIESVLKSEKYAEITETTPESDIPNGKVYYRLRASVSNEEKLSILDKAFQQGAILIIDEIDSCPLLEDHLNAYLTGEDIHGNRPEKPGFTVLSTANGAAMKGRRMLPAPLKSRMLAFEFDEYPREELIAILESKFIAPCDITREVSRSEKKERQLKTDMIAFLVDSFLTEQHTDKETPPTFRDLYVVAKDYFEKQFTQYQSFGFTKSQHEFLLVYRKHPQFSQLVSRFESGELKAAELDLDGMKKSLDTENSPRLFGKLSSDSLPQTPPAPPKDERQLPKT